MKPEAALPKKNIIVSFLGGVSNLCNFIISKVMADNSEGLYSPTYPNGYKSKQDIMTEQSIDNPAKITFPRVEGHDLNDWWNIATNRQNERDKIDDNYTYAKIELSCDHPAVFGISADWHLGARINLPMLKNDVNIMANHPFVKGNFFLGDLTHSANFNMAQDDGVMSFEEERAWMIDILDYIGKERISALWKGNHDHKFEAKYGTSKYAGLSEKYDCPVFYGNAYLDVIVNNIQYKFMGGHELRGHSMYTKAHPAIRAHKEVQGLDVTMCGHVHERGLNEQATRQFNGARDTKAVVTGTYEYGGSYAKDGGWGTQVDPEQGMYWVILNHDKKMIRIMRTAEMLETMQNYF